jgi:hypothetical protein
MTRQNTIGERAWLGLIVILVLVPGLLLAACGEEASEVTTTQAPATTTTTEATTTTEPATTTAEAATTTAEEATTSTETTIGGDHPGSTLMLYPDGIGGWRFGANPDEVRAGLIDLLGNPTSEGQDGDDSPAVMLYAKWDGLLVYLGPARQTHGRGPSSGTATAKAQASWPPHLKASPPG